MRITTKIALLPLIALTLVLPAGAQQGSPAEQFPADTFAYLEVDTNALDRGLKQLDLAVLLQNPEFTDFFLPMFEQVGADPARPLDSLFEQVPIQQFLAGSAAIGLRGMKIQIQHPDGGETNVEISPSQPVEAQNIFDLAGLVASAGIDEDFWNPLDFEYEVGLDLAVILDPGPALMKHVQGVLQAPEELAWIVSAVDKETISGRQVTHVTLNAMTTQGIVTDIWADLTGERWMLATNRSTFEQMATLHPGNSLAKSKTFSSVRERVSAVDPVVFYFSDFAKEMEIVRNFIPPILHDMLEVAGVNSLEGCGLAVSMTEGGVRESFTLALDGEPKGIWRLFEAKQGGIDMLKKAPADAMVFLGHKLDLAIFMDRFEGLMGELLPGTEKRIQPRLAAGLQEFGIDLRKDILETLGDEITFVQFAPQTVMAVPDWVLMIEAKNEANMAALLGKIEMIAKEAGAPVNFQAFELEGATMARRLVVENLPMLPPTLAVQNGSLIVASRADLISRAANEWGANPAHTLAGGSEVFQQTLRGLTGGEIDDATMLMFVDLRALLPPLLAATIGMMPPEFVDTSFYPDVELMAEHFSGVALTARRNDEGITFDAFSPTGVVIPMMVMGLREVTYEQRTDDALALNNEAWNLVKDPGREPGSYSEGVQLAEIANQLAPNNPYYLNTLGVAQYRHGDYGKALASLTRSDELNQQSPSPFNRAHDLLFLSMAHWQAGNTERALELLAISQQLLKDDDSEELADFLKEAQLLMAPPAS